MKCLGQETFFFSTRRMLISVLWEACYGQPGEKKNTKFWPPPGVCLQTAAAKGCCGLWEEKAFWQAPAMLLYINLKYRKVLNHIFDRQLFSAKKALRMKNGKAFFAIARSQPARH